MKIMMMITKLVGLGFPAAAKTTLLSLRFGNVCKFEED